MRSIRSKGSKSLICLSEYWELYLDADTPEEKNLAAATIMFITGGPAPAPDAEVKEFHKQLGEVTQTDPELDRILKQIREKF